MAERGGKRPGAGRKKGSRNKATDEQLGSLTKMAQSHAPLALRTLVSIAQGGESEAARVSAANAILDRGYGKPPQALDHTSSDGSMTPRPALDVSKLSTAALAEIMAAADVPDKSGPAGG